MADVRDMPSWLTEPENYRPGNDRDGFVTLSLLSVTRVLARFRLDDGQSSPLSPSAPAKLVFGLACILMVSLSRNMLFVLVVLAALMVRVALLPQKALTRVAGGAVAAAGFTLLLMLPAALMGQPHSPVMLATKSLVCVGITLTVALTTPQAQLTGALRSFGLPGIVILTIDLTLRSIVRLGESAAEVLCALKLRSVGRNLRKQATIGGVAGAVLIKASRAAQDTYDAMRCRGFDGSYRAGKRLAWHKIDLLWLALLAALVVVCIYLQGAV